MKINCDCGNIITTNKDEVNCLKCGTIISFKKPAKDEWNSDIDDMVVRPIAKKAITLYAERVILEKKLECKVNGYDVRMILNPIIHEDIYKELWPDTKDAKYMINVEVGIPCGDGDGTRWFVGLYFKFDDKNGWIEEDMAKKLTSY